MPRLRDYFKEDLRNTFFNEDEFAIDALIEGEEVTVIVDNDKLEERKLQKEIEGLHTEELLFYVIKGDISFYPRPENKVRVDGSNWKVIEVLDDEGMFTIIVELVGA